MNFLPKFILLVTISWVPFAAAGNTLESIFTIDLAKNDGNWPNVGECKITKLIIKDDLPVATNHDNPDPEEGFAEMKARFAPLSNLRGKIDERPRIVVQIPRFFTPSYNKNMNRIDALFEALNISGAEVFGLAEEIAPQSFLVEKTLIFATCAPLIFRAGKSIFWNQNADVRANFILSVHGFVSTALQAALFVTAPKWTFAITSIAVTAMHDLLTTAGFRTYHLLVSVLASAWYQVGRSFSGEPLASAWVYCIGHKPNQAIVDPEDYMNGFHNSRFSPFCEMKFIE